MAGGRFERGAERVLKSFGFTLLCFALWAWLSAGHVRALAREFSWMESLWVVYNVLLALLFLVRRRPSVVSLNPVHWLVALITSFAGFFFERDTGPLAGGEVVGEGLIVAGVLVSGTSALALGRCYDFLPALRGVATGWLYAAVRHPMYLASLMIRGGYLLRHLSLQNAAVFAAMVWLYDRRAAFEEQIMSADAGYRAYAARVRWRFVPRVW